MRAKIFTKQAKRFIFSRHEGGSYHAAVRIYGISSCYTSVNWDAISSEAYFRQLIDLGFLFMLEVFPTDYDYTELPEYQAICGLTVDGANYNLIAELPTDVQFANENADLYRSMSNDFSAILKSLTFSKGVTRTEVTAPAQSSGSGS